MKTTVFISFYESYPPVFGAAVVTYNVAKHFPGKKFIFQLSGETRNIYLEPDVNICNFRMGSTGPFTKFINIVIDLPRIVNRLRNIQPDLIIIEGASWTVYYLLLFYAIKISNIKSRIVYHAHNVEYLLRKEKNGKVVALLTKIAEARLMTKSDLCTAVSREDKDHFSKLYNVEPEIFPNGVDIAKFQSLDTCKVGLLKEKYRLEGLVLLFMGMPHYLPNKQAIEFLVQHVCPVLLERGYDIKLAVIGGLIGNGQNYIVNPGIIPFEEVPYFLKACDVCVAPIFTGSGTRLKILEYMAAEKPVVSTTKGAEGLLYENKKNILIADDPSTFIEAISQLFDNPEISKKIGKEGMEMVSENYSWANIVNDFLDRVEITS